MKPRFATVEEVQMVHSETLIQEVQRYSEMEMPIDLDTVLSKGSYKSALKAVGAGLVAVDGVREGKFERAFCTVRPPGHHATPTRAMGFCLFNNIAITAKYAQKLGYQRVMIIDFDVHHGNGTQDTFYSDGSVLYFSTHQSFAFPHTGSWQERGDGEGKGYTLNFPLMPESGDDEILHHYHNDLQDAYEFFQPDIILVSAGYDLHESDPLATLNVTTNGIREIVRSILKLGDKPTIFMLEGGYSLYDLGFNVLATVEEMLEL